MRYFFEIAYHGEEFHGWQRQDNASSVQQTVEEALETLLRSKVGITGSGRTDTGVHCLQQYFHADLEALNDLKEFRFKLNSLLPRSIAISSIHEVNDEAHARFDALERYYEYHICTEKDPFRRQTSYMLTKPLDLENMNRACTLLVGEKDFQSFSKVRTHVNTFICCIFEAHWEKRGHLLVFKVRANRFLRGMVRALVGTLIEIGKNKIPPEEMATILEKKDRRAAGAAVPPQGLFLKEVKYPEGLLKD